MNMNEDSFKTQLQYSEEMLHSASRRVINLPARGLHGNHLTFICSPEAYMKINYTLTKDTWNKPGIHRVQGDA